MNRRGAVLRRILALCCTICLLSPLLAAHAAESEGATGTAIDLVILIDDSTSMFQNASGKPGNDSNQMRREAAAIMLNLCELKTSRAAVLSFGGYVRDIAPLGMNYDDGLISISGDSIENREKLTQAVLRPKGMMDYTDVAAALERAAELFGSTPEIRGNQRVVLLLTDDKPYVPPYTNPKPQECVENGEQLLKALMKENPVYNPDNAGHARVYVVKLLNQSSSMAESNGLYELVARQTGGRVYAAQQAAELPQQFSKMMADQIGSRLDAVQAEPYQKPDGSFGIGINIPNHSVTEANILMNMDGVQADSVRLYQPLQTGQTQADAAITDNRTVFQSTTPSFIQYKIVADNQNGVWELTYRRDPAVAAADAEAQPNATVLVLFSYNLTLQGGLAIVGDQHPVAALEKNDALTVTARFLDESGEPSTDKLLYQPQGTVSGQTVGIGVRAWAVRKASAGGAADMPGSALALTPSQQGQGMFSLTCKPADLGVTGAGEYLLYLHAEGDGLVRDLSEPIPFTVVNNPPVFLQNPSITLPIHDPALPGMPGQAQTVIGLGDGNLCYDADEGFDRVTLTGASMDTRIVQAARGEGGDSVTLAAVGAGQCDVALTASDGEANGTVRCTVPVTVLDVAKEIAKRYNLRLSVTAPEADGGVYPIGSKLTLLMTLEDILPDGPVSLDTYDLDATLTAADESGAATPVPLTRIPGQPAWQGELPCGMRTRTLSLDGSVRVGLAENGYSLRLAQPLSVRVGNAEPVVLTDAVDGNRFAYWVEPSWLDARQPDGQYRMDLTACFADDDDPGDLVYAAWIVPSDAAPATLAEAEALTAVDATAVGVNLSVDGQLTITPGRAGSYRLVAAVRDTEGQSALFTRDVTVSSIRAEAEQRALFLALLAAAAIAAGLLLYWLLKPGYRGLMLDIFIRGVFQESKRLPTHKRKANMMCVWTVKPGVEGALISDALNAIAIKPGRRNTLLVRPGKPLTGTVTAVLDNVKLRPRKWTRMRKNSMLTLQLRQNGQDTAYSWKLSEAPRTNAAAARGMPAMPGGGARKPKRPY